MNGICSWKVLITSITALGDEAPAIQIVSMSAQYNLHPKRIMQMLCKPNSEIANKAQEDKHHSDWDVSSVRLRAYIMFAAFAASKPILLSSITKHLQRRKDNLA